VIDRLVRGRAWILALGVMLAGIVAMQVEVLKLGASIGRAVQRSSELALRNEQLQTSVASLADDQRIERVAAGMGMVMAPPASVGFLNASHGAKVGAAIASIHQPTASAFLNSSSSNGFVVTPASLAAANAIPTATAPGTAPTGATASLPGTAPTGATTTAPETTSQTTTTPAGG
jgi:hypothetical protein